MIKPDWKDAPEWAGVMVQQHGFCGIVYCWAESHEDKAKAKWSTDPEWMEFSLKKNCWDFTEPRP